MKLLKYLLPVGLAMLMAAPAYAHFLWINTVKDSSGAATVQLCFGEEAGPCEANLVDRIAKVKLMHQKADGKPAELKTEKSVNGDKGSFNAQLPTADGAFTAAWDYGMIERGGKTFVLNYYAKHIDASQPDAIKAVAKSESLRLDIVPAIAKDVCELTVIFDGKPAPADSQVLVVSSTQDEQELKTDAHGKVSFKLAPGTKYELRARVKNDKPGTRDGKEYAHEMHYCTLVFTTPAK
ncbi:MAG TPA: DUF4198 domain-containing protein [Pirellulaceae bacterium]|nr:DUF4198 domain-containing protein [Pirellulaceae bacterium]